MIPFGIPNRASGPSGGLAHNLRTYAAGHAAFARLHPAVFDDIFGKIRIFSVKMFPHLTIGWVGHFLLSGLPL